MKQEIYLSKLTIPCHWDKEVVDQIVKQNKPQKKILVNEVYGVLTDGGPIGHGRSRKTVVAAGKKQALNFRLYLRQIGLSFTYLLNAPFEFKNDSQLKQKVDRYLDWVLNELQPDALKITSYELMKYIRKVNRKIPIHISTISGIKSVEELQKFMDIKPSRVTPHHDLGKRWHNLKKIVKFTKKNGMEIELMVTESCLFKCNNRERHYSYLANASKDSPFHTTCNSKKLIYPKEFLQAGGVVRPEDLHFFEKMGITHFKISGRSKQASWLPEVAKAYQERKYEGNLIKLLGIDPSIQAENWIYINNSPLKGFLKNFPQANYEEATAYCNKWIIKLYKEGNFKLLDGSSYSIENGTLVLRIPGKRVFSLINRENEI